MWLTEEIKRENFEIPFVLLYVHIVGPRATPAGN